MSEASYFFPGQLIQEADGSFNINVTGHVHAQGLDLDAGTSVAPSAQDRVRWLRTSDGALVADLAAYTLAAGQALRERAYGITPTDTSQAVLDVVDDLGTEQGYVSVAQTGRGSSATVSVSAGGQDRTVIDKTGISGFLQALGGAGGGGSKISRVGIDTVHFPGGSQFSNLKNIKLTGATGANVQMIANAYNVLGTGVLILCGPDGAGGSNIQAWSSVAPAAADVTFQYLQWGN